jgi:hypothetical protein
MPPFIKDQLKLTKEQEKQLADLEAEVKSKLLKILTPDQKKLLDELKDKGPGGKFGPPGGPGGKFGPPGGPGGKPGGPPPGEEGPPPPKGSKEKKDPQASARSGIQWYATWESGLREAQRTGRPILLVSAAPHCAGVSGTW